MLKASREKTPYDDFDYWSPETLRKLATLPESLDEVKQSQLLNTEEQRLYEAYHTILRLRETSPALREGAFFDVMYVNHQSISGFDPNRHYAFCARPLTRLFLLWPTSPIKTLVWESSFPRTPSTILHLTEGTFCCA